MNEIKMESTISDQLTNEVMSDLNVFGPRVLNMIFRDIDGTGIVIIDSKTFLTNTIIKKKFLRPKKLGATAISSNVFNLSNGERDRILPLAHS